MHAQGVSRYARFTKRPVQRYHQALLAETFCRVGSTETAVKIIDDELGVISTLKANTTAQLPRSIGYQERSC